MGPLACMMVRWMQFIVRFRGREPRLCNHAYQADIRSHDTDAPGVVGGPPEAVRTPLLKPTYDSIGIKMHKPTILPSILRMHHKLATT